tara:strand:- start:11 stop:463 length:453 start_codon:yes stop_codon:yes gene_type:complete
MTAPATPPPDTTASQQYNWISPIKLGNKDMTEFFGANIVVLLGILFVLVVSGLVGRWSCASPEKEVENFTNKKDTQESEEPCYNGTDSNLINTPLCSEQTYENTSLANSSPSNFEVLKNVNIKETNKIVTVKDGIDDYTNQPTFLPGKFN